MSDSNSSGGGIGFFGLLQVVFITLKLRNVITWSWWLVFLPAWIAIGLTILIIGLAVLAIALKD